MVSRSVNVQYSAGTYSQVEVARYFIEAGVIKHSTRIDVLFLKAVRSSIVSANLLSHLITQSSSWRAFYCHLATSFPRSFLQVPRALPRLALGLPKFSPVSSFPSVSSCQWHVSRLHFPSSAEACPTCRIVLNGQELLTSNMLVFPMAVWKRAVPWWGLPYNWLVGKSNFGPVTLISNIHPYTSSIFREPRWQPLRRCDPRTM